LIGLAGPVHFCAAIKAANKPAQWYTLQPLFILVIRRLHQQKCSGLREDKYNALIERAGEIGAEDFDLPDPWATDAAKAAE
jgi:hypothetical protein